MRKIPDLFIVLIGCVLPMLVLLSAKLALQQATLDLTSGWPAALPDPLAALAAITKTRHQSTRQNPAVVLYNRNDINSGVRRRLWAGPSRGAPTQSERDLRTTSGSQRIALPRAMPNSCSSRRKPLSAMGAGSQHRMRRVRSSAYREHKSFADVRYWHLSGHRLARCTCLLLTQRDIQTTLSQLC